MSEKNIWKLLIGIAFLALLYFPIFLRLDHKPLREWDEARNAVNALEMSETQEWMVKTFRQNPDLWETKPPLMVWLQVAGFKLFGYGELGVRLPSALSTLALCIFLPLFFMKHFNMPLIGILAALVLVTTNGYIHDHASRTGDHDAMLVCFEMIMLCTFFMFSETEKTVSLVSAAIFFTLAVYTKSISVMMLFPGMLLYLVSHRKFLPLVKDGRTWAALGLALACIAAYYINRERMAPGYLKAVWENELFPRYFNSASTYQYNVSDFWYYARELQSYHFIYWLWFLFPAILVNMLSCRGRLRRFHSYVLINSIVFFLIISKGTTNTWYMLPLIPMFAMIIGIFFYQLGKHATSYLSLSEWPRILLFIALLFCIFSKPYADIMTKVMDTAENNGQVEYAYVLRRMEKQMPEVKHIAVYKPAGYNNPLIFYRDWYNRHKGYHIEYTDSLESFAPGTYVMLLEEYLPELQQAHIPYKLLFGEFNCLLVKLQP